MAESRLLWSNFQPELGETTTVSGEISGGFGEISSKLPWMFAPREGNKKCGEGAYQPYF